jgi:DNA polymerase elongation subunit (family B)
MVSDMRNDYSNQIKELAETTKLTNAQIARKLGCSKRTVRRHAGPYAERLQKFFGITPDDLKKEGAKILLFDIETAPMEVFVWQLKQNGWISPESVIKDWSILTWSAKWLFDDTMYSARVTAAEAKDRRDASIIQPLWDLLDEAHIIIAHNGARFDVRRMNARFALNGYNPPLPYRVIDTLRVARRQFDFASYKLDYINQLFGLEQKGHPGYDLWKRSVQGNEDADVALQRMRDYCDNDVKILEELYVQIRPWIKGHPNMGLYIDTDGESCTNCGNTELDWRGKYYTPAGRYLAFRCKSCGAVGRSRTTDIDKEERKRIVLGVA